MTRPRSDRFIRTRAWRALSRALLMTVAVLGVHALLLPDLAEAKRRGGLKPGFKSRSHGKHYGGRSFRGHRGYRGFNRGYRGYRGYRRYGYGYYGYGRPYRDPFFYGYGVGPWFWPAYGPRGWEYHHHHHDDGHDHGVHDTERHSHGPARHRPTPTEKVWELLARGSEKRALTAFAKEAKADQTNALAKVGYAVSAGLLGDYELGVMGMRRAARTDARALAAAPIDERLHGRILGLVDAYHPEDHSGGHGPDAHFMAAALLLVAGELDSAEVAVQVAIDDGDSDESATALRDVIVEVREAVAERDAKAAEEESAKAGAEGEPAG